MNKLSLSMLMSTLITSSVMASSNGKIETSFTGLDSDGDELLTSSELEGTSLAPYLENIDTNGDSAINLSEFNEYVKANTSKFSEDVIATVDENSVEDAVSVVNFEKADINGDGTLSSAEVSKANIDGNFTKMDKDGDGALTKTELEHYLKMKGKQ